MVALAQIIEHDLSSERRKDLITKLNKHGFKVSGGSVYVKKPKKKHPSVFLSPLLSYFLPIGFIDSYFSLINLDKNFPKDYHSQLRKICEIR